jgi:hypothetical protein
MLVLAGRALAPKELGRHAHQRFATSYVQAMPCVTQAVSGSPWPHATPITLAGALGHPPTPGCRLCVVPSSMGLGWRIAGLAVHMTPPRADLVRAMETVAV